MIEPTLACAGAPGILKPGAARLVQVTSAAVAGLVEGLLVELGPAALVIAAIVGGTTYDALNVCSRPDPGDPGLTIDDIIECGNPSGLASYTAASQRVYQWFEHVMWPLWCDCANGSVPPANPQPALPAGDLNPGLPSGSSGQPCWQGHAFGQGQDANGNTIWNFDQLLPPAQVPGHDPAYRYYPNPLPSSANATLDYVAGTTNPANMRVVVAQINAGGGTDTNLISPTVATTQHLSFSWTPSPTAVAYTIGYDYIFVGGNPTFYNGQFEAGHVLYCGAGGATNPVVPCCPPDPILDQRLAQILQYEKIIVQLLGAPLHAHVDGVKHANLSGSGSITLVDSVDAIRVNVTNDLTNWPHNPGDPNYYLSLGFVTSIAAGSPLKGWRLVYLAQTYPIVPYADQIGYTLPPGVTVDITELLPA